MPKYHPDSFYLNDYAAGTLPVAFAVLVQAHLEHCEQCRSHVTKMQQLGATLFEQTQTTANVSASLLDKIFAEIECAPKKVNQIISEERHNDDLPRVVRKLLSQPLEKMPWRKLTRKLAFFRLSTGDKKIEVRLYNIQAGGKIPHHTHTSDEVTLVIKGSFSDKDGVYKKGDFVVRGKGEEHQPIATQDESCLCLSALEQPIQFTGFARIFNRLLKVSPA